MTSNQNIIDKFWQAKHIRNLVVSVIIGCVLLYVNHEYWPKLKFVEEFIIVFIAAFAVSAYFEFVLRKGISEQYMKMYELKEELGKAGVVKYYSSFKDVTLREYFAKGVKNIDIYVHFADTVFNQISVELDAFCRKRKNKLTIYMLSPDNKFIAGLGELWGFEEKKYNEAGIRLKIKSSLSTLDTIVKKLKNEKKLKAKVSVRLLKRNPVFYSFYRFDDTLLYVPSKISSPRIIIPPAFLVVNNHTESGIYSKCMEELDSIATSKNSFDTYYSTEHG